MDSTMQTVGKEKKLRKSGILLHITSLPCEEGVGTLGEFAHQFLDALHRAGQQSWQMLPIHTTDRGGSPFNGSSLFAGNPNLIDLKILVTIGDLSEAQYQGYLDRWRAYKQQTSTSDRFTNYDFLWRQKHAIPLRHAYEGFRRNPGAQRQRAFEAFARKNHQWLTDYASFMALKGSYGWNTKWSEWDKQDKFTAKRFEKHLDGETIDFYKYLQFAFDEQMTTLCAKAKELGVELIGDLPMYPAYDSADVWANQDMFQLEKKTGRMRLVAAVPPDYFSKKGQRWGYPLFKWGVVGTQGDHERLYAWWLKRIGRESDYLNLIKLDHFRGIVAYGSVRSTEKDASKARWNRGPGKEFFEYLQKHLGSLPFILEDLGVITADVRKLRRQVGPGIKVFQFADFAGDPAESNHIYLPHNQVKDPRCVYYTGTHDNETLRQWVEESLNKPKQRNLKKYLSQSSEKDVHWQAIDMISASAAERVIFPMQDLLNLGKHARMNHPSVAEGQWRWRMTKEEFEQFRGKVGTHLFKITKRNKRI